VFHLSTQAACRPRQRLHGGRCYLGYGGEEAELLVAVAALIGVVEDQEHIADRELVPVQAQFADDGMVHGGGAAFEAADVVARPKYEISP
jgi:hypothetical protein